MVCGIGGVTLDRIAVVRDLPGWDGIEHISRSAVQPGGMTATAMVAVSRLGVGARFIGGIGDDEEGRLVMESFRREGVDAAGVEVFPGERTSFSHVLVQENTGKRAILHSRGVQERTGLSAGRINLEDVKVLHIDGFWYDTALDAVKKARSMGIAVSMDPSTSLGRDRGEVIFPLVDFLIPSYHFARIHTGIDDPRAAAEYFLRYGCRAVAMTMGGEGCLLLEGGTRLHIPAYSVDTVDTTGAGDVFHGAFCAATAMDYGIVEGMKFASAAAAMKCSTLGGQLGIPSKDEVRRFQAARG